MCLPSEINQLTGIDNLEKIVSDYFCELMAVHSIVYSVDVNMINQTIENGPLVLVLQFKNPSDCIKILPHIPQCTHIYDSELTLAANRLSENEILVTVFKIN